MQTCWKPSLILIRKCSNTVKNTTFDNEILLTAENRARCMKLMKRDIQQSRKEPSSYASVLVPLVHDIDRNGDLSLLYTVRSGNLRSHYRQVAFPGMYSMR